MALPNPEIDARGWLAGVDRVVSPNHDSRPAGTEIRLLVIHGISLPPGEFGGGYVQQLFCNRLDPGGHPYFAEICNLEVSAHCLIEREGRVTQFVSLDDRAWHAGESSWRGETACNDFSIGIELEGCDELAYGDAQYEALAALIGALRARYPAIEADAVTGHSDIAPGRKTDPGPAFDWSKLRSML